MTKNIVKINFLTFFIPGHSKTFHKLCHSTCANLLYFSYLSKIIGLLESPDVELRIVAGETIALMYELQRGIDEVRLQQ